jgi:hypothetical protein
MPAGRPTKYKDSMCDTVLACGDEGGSVAEMAAACDVCVDTLYEWSKVHEAFSEAFTRAQTKAEAFHAKRVREGLTLSPSEFQGAANLKYMAQRFQERWSEKRQVEHSGGMQVEQITRKIVDPKQS